MWIYIYTYIYIYSGRQLYVYIYIDREIHSCLRVSKRMKQHIVVDRCTHIDISKDRSKDIYIYIEREILLRDHLDRVYFYRRQHMYKAVRATVRDNNHRVTRSTTSAPVCVRRVYVDIFKCMPSCSARTYTYR